MEPKHIAIIGAGFSGTMLTVHLLRHTTYPLVISLLEQTGRFAEGVAYSTTNPNHLLNVRAAKISAYPDKPDHLTIWLKERETYWRSLHPDFESLTLTPQSFIPRMIFGAYLKDQLATAQKLAHENGHEIRLLPHRAQQLQLEGNYCKVTTSHGEIIADAVLLASGSLQPKGFSYEKKLFQTPHLYASNVWNPPIGNILHSGQQGKEHETVAIIGSGLTMVDMVISLRDKGFKGKILSFSRHGNLPSVHEEYTPYPYQWQAEALPKTTLELFRWLRTETKKAASEGYHWQAVVDSLRNITNPLWQQLPPREKRKLLQHLASLWSIHRHRIPPESAIILQKLQASGQLQFIKGSIIDADGDGDSLVISYRKKYTPGIQTMRVSYLLNCTGSESDIGKTPRNGLLYRLYETGYITTSSLRAGLEQQNGFLKGEAATHLFAIGPLFFGSLFETIAVPELRQQAQDCALHLLEFLRERSNNFVI